MQRITYKNLDGCCEALNELLGLPLQPWKDGKGQAGCIHIDSGYGSVDVVQMSNEGGGVSSLSGSCTKREAHAWLCAAIRGVQLARQK
ncbi:hypothetical protein [uncultured phage_MedDCM-OCT-S31-C1]|uniref:Uncharacterized protein n=1 Tax=uncultured phage_MedDCM-OCT-S31-C1 TaxID=2740800 RepID=A0A6S4PEC5_9CAUD|nr:hypothetical protein HOQ55_gp36 [uncultured phage_MedDCM-OCT-S31-C1]BAQ94418.1 hypothetical protein [uncultured phage_MedDCM-OCT-S31-C1]